MAPARNTTFTKSFVRKPGARADTSIPITTEAPPPLRQPTKVARSKTLTRPERSQPQVPLINPQGVGRSAGRGEGGPWTVFSLIVTCWAPAFLLKACGGMKESSKRQAWREKVALVFIALLMGGFVGFVTMGLNKALCPASAQVQPGQTLRIGVESAIAVGVNGWDMDIEKAKLPDTAEVGYNMFTRASKQSGYDVTPLLVRTVANDFPACAGQTGAFATADSCTTTNKLPKCPLGALTMANFNQRQMRNTTRRVGYAWEDLATGQFPNFMVLDGEVLNMQPYFNAVPNALPNDKVDRAIRTTMQLALSGGRDATRMFYTQDDLRKAVPCLKQKYLAGRIDKVTPGCFVSNLFLYVSLVIILGLVFVRFFMALWFSWFMSWKMSATPRDYGTAAHHRMPAGALTTVDQPGSAPWANKERPPPSRPARLRHDDGSLNGSTTTGNSSTVAMIGNEPYVVCLVTAYSEGEEGISNTLTSLAETEYPDSRKLLFVVADGMVTGEGESMSTPDICVGLLEADARFGTPMPMSFISVAQGKKQHNMAMVYAGHYTRGRGHRTPLIVVVKCGAPDEASEKKPGNRGKRDSQMILMNFLQRVTYNDRMTPLDFDLFRKFHALMGVTPDFFELCMMVDADTKVYPKSMRCLVNCMMRDHLIMGACGETRISNKRTSWVTAIQVYEYFISHHMVKAFESVFGGVTCLPGCFSMYRIKARKPQDDDWVPVIVKPEVTREYSQSTVTTLHQKNLLLLGEDRFLTTMLLRTFPNRKMVFVPQARCRTEVPHTFKMLLSQRRRWINSTVHNLMELVLVKDLCGTFCFSMQFVVFMDLVGTAVLPIAIALTYTLIATYCINPPRSFTEAIPLMLLIAVIGLPAVLILLATRKVVYTMWMLIYLVFLPVWNFVLPVYSFWHFDDFGWGETRKVEGEGAPAAHDDAEGTFQASAVPLRRWQDWELSRIRKIKREEKRRRDLEKQFGQGFYNDNGSGELPMPGSGQQLPPFGGAARRPDSESISDFASSADPDEEFWGDIGAYREEQPPPLAIVRHSVWVDGQEVLLGQKDMESMLEKGFSDDEWTASGVPRTTQPLGPSAAHRVQSMRFRATQEQPVPKIPDRFGRGAPALMPALSSSSSSAPGAPVYLERTPSPGDYSTMHGSMSEIPLIGGANGSQTSFRGGSSSAVGVGVGSQQAQGQGQHARQRSQGSGQYRMQGGQPGAGAGAGAYPYRGPPRY